MSQERRRGRTIATDIVQVTLVVGIVIAVAAAIVGVTGASRLASAEVVSQQRAGMHRVEDTAEVQIAAAGVIVEQTAGAVGAAKDVSSAAQLTKSLAGSDGALESLTLLDANGRPLGSRASSNTERIPRSILESFARASASIVVQDTGTDGTPNVWIARTSIIRSGDPVLVLGKVDTSFLTSLVREAAAEQPGSAVLVIGPGGHIEAAAGPELDLGRAKWTRSGRDGVVTARATNGTPMSGLYTPIHGIPGLNWRVALVQPRSAVVSATFQAVGPSIGVLILGGLVALAIAWVISAQLSDPLRSLEEAAYRAAEGSYVKPLKADRDDEVGRLADAFNAVAMRLNALHDLSQLLASSTHLDQVLDGILSAMEHIIGPGITAIYLLDDSRDLLKPVRAHGAQLDVLPCMPARGEGWIIEALSAIEPRVVTGLPGRLREILPGLAPEQAREAIAIPLVSGYEAIGVIVYVSESERGFTEAETEMLRTFAAQAAVAVNNSRMFAEEGESREIAETLQAVAEDLVGAGNLGEALESVVVRLRDLFGAREVQIAFVDRASLGMPPSFDPAREDALVTMAIRTLALGEADSPTTIPKGVDAEADALLDRHGASELLVVPTGMSSGHGAVLVVVPGPGGVRPRDIELADAVSDEIALALDNAYFYERAITRASNLETIFRISQALSSSLQFNIVLNRVLDVVQKIFSADAVWLLTYDRPRRVLRTEMARGTVSSEILDLSLRPGEDVFGFVYESGEPGTFRSIAPDSAGVQRIAYSLGLRAMLAVPLLARGRSIGVLAILSSEQNAFSDEDLSVLQTFAAQASLAIDTARLYSHEHEVATILQRSITPEALPELAEVETGSVYVPVGPDSEIGGDYYDMMRAPDGSIVFAIGDVVGKGIIAATKTSMIKYSVRALVAAGLGPALVLREVNRMVAESGDAGDIVTLWLGQYDSTTRRLRWASGGHPPGLSLRAQGGIEPLVATGPLLGVMPDVDYDEESVSVDPGDTVLLYTDGVTEARAGSKFFGEEQVRRTLEAGGTCEDIVQRLMAAVRLFAEGDLRDDVAIVAVRFTGRVSNTAEIGTVDSTVRGESSEAWPST
ncbi:MAG: SpoIIE family protein phosphatase [Coriobacteriales bacterium]|nr:SpoIIE family protein phosphatase [Coriobacteriales bacterium]